MRKRFCKFAAHMGHSYLDMLDAFEEPTARNVTADLYERHLKPLFLAIEVSAKRYPAPAGGFAT